MKYVKRERVDLRIDIFLTKVISTSHCALVGWVVFFVANTLVGQISVQDSLAIWGNLDSSRVCVDRQPTNSLRFAQQAQQLSIDRKYPYGESEALRRIGIVYLNQSDYPKALENILNALRIAEKEKSEVLISKCLMNLGSIYDEYGEHNLALSYFNKALKIATKIGDNQSIANCLTNAANVYSELNNELQALNYYQSALNTYVKLQDRKGIGVTMSNIGNIYFNQNKYKESESYYLKALKIAKENDDYQRSIIVLNNLANLYIATQKPSKAIEYAYDAMNMAKLINARDDVQRAAFTLSTIYRTNEDYKTALAFYEYGSTIKDSIFSENINREIGKLESKHELEKRENQIQLLRKDKALIQETASKNIFLRNLIIAGILLGASSVVLVVQHQKNRKIKEINQQLLKTNSEIAAKNEAMKVLNDELDSFIYRSSHDLKAPLTSVIGLINIASLEPCSVPVTTYLERIKECVDKLMIVLSDLTNYSKNSRTQLVSEPIQFETLVNKALEDLKYLDKWSKVKFSLNIHSNGEFFSDPHRISILLNSLISNAIIHNRFSLEEPWVQITIDSNKQKADITVSDSGIGIDYDIQDKIFKMFFKGSNESPGSGLGLYIAMGVVKKLKGTISYTTEINVGSVFSVQLPAIAPESLASDSQNKTF